jgi:hypothetical protein
MRRRTAPAEQYVWLLTADPPVCAVGPALGTLRRCDRLRRGEHCFCRFAAADIAEDLAAAGAPDLAAFLEMPLEPDDVEELRDGLEQVDLDEIGDEALAERLTTLLADLRRLVRVGAGLTDRYADDLD